MRSDVPANEALIQFLYRLPVGLVQTDAAGNVEVINPTAVQLLLPMSDPDGLQSIFSVLGSVLPQLRTQIEAFDEATGLVVDSVRFRPGEPERAGATLAVSVLKLDRNRLLMSIADVSAAVLSEGCALRTKLLQAEKIDALTGMYNRKGLTDRLASMTEGRGRIALLLIDCDRFERIKDTYGRSVGDKLLRLMSRRLQNLLRRDDRNPESRDSMPMVARLGGDEFAVLLGGLVKDDEVHAVCRRIIGVLAQPYTIGSDLVHASVSIGVVMNDGRATDPDQLLHDSSIALREARRRQPGSHRVFETEMRARAARRGDLEDRLHRALNERELFVVYQPIIDLSTQRLIGVEALARWRDPTRGLVPPLEFIEIAERCGLIADLGSYVLERACEDFLAWTRTHPQEAPGILAVNLSRAQLLEAGLRERVARVLERFRMPAERLQFEVTESQAAQGDEVRERLVDLKSLGIGLALDDFGTGYSSLASLSLLPIDVVKIDRSFVSRLPASAHHRVLIEATVLVARSLGMRTVAEGIETAAQLECVTELGCDKGQGYYIGRPVTTPELLDWIEASRMTRSGRCKRAIIAP